MALDVIFKSLEPTIKPPDNSINPILLASVAASDPCEAQFSTAQTFLEAVYGDSGADRGRNSRAQTPMSCSSRANTPSMVSLSPPPQINAKSPYRAFKNPWITSPKEWCAAFPRLPGVRTAKMRGLSRPKLSETISPWILQKPVIRTAQNDQEEFC